MKEIYQIPRVTLAWILVALTAVILPHVGRMPFWLTLLSASCVVVRILIFNGRMSYPGSKTKGAIVIFTLVAVLVQFGRDVFSTEATVGVLIVGITLKLLEMQHKRDVLLVIYLCYFTVVAEFIYSQSIPIAAYMMLCILLITSSLVSLNQDREHQRPLKTLKLSGYILAQSVPLMMVLFLVFPRISPLWSVPLSTGGGVTGLSETMSPGDIGNLTRSGDVAFRVQFKSDPPPKSELYWRGLTLDFFDGHQWRRRRRFSQQNQYLGNNPREKHDWFQAIQYLGNEVSYNVIMEPTYQNWLFTLKIPQIRKDGLVMLQDFQVENIRPVSQRFTYDANSFLDNTVGLEMSFTERGRQLNLPDEGNQRSRELARQLRQQYPDDEAYIAAVLDMFRQQNFFYTLNPKVLGENTVDDFLFSTKEGFCEHYASAFTFLMRAAGIPSRIVTGYQGGEFNPYDGTLIVRQYDAHAWSEVWLEGQGWIRVDPTRAVAPQRIDLGSELTYETEDSFLEDVGFSMLRFRNNAVINDLRLRLETIDYAWNRWVLNYDQGVQLELFARIFGSVTREKILIILLSVFIIFFSFASYFVLRRPVRKVMDPATALYLRYCRYLGKLGFERRPGETPVNFCKRVSEHNPQWGDELASITDTFVKITFLGADDEKAMLEKLARSVRNFRLLN